MSGWKAVWRGGREKRREGSVSHTSFAFLKCEGCHGFSPRPDGVKKLPHTQPLRASRAERDKVKMQKAAK